MINDVRIFEIKKTLIFILCMFLVTFYLQELSSFESLYGSSFEGENSLFLLNLKRPFDYGGLSFFFSMFSHVSWSHFFVNAFFLIVFSAWIEKEIASIWWAILCVCSHLTSITIAILTYNLQNTSQNYFVLGSSAIILAMVSFQAVRYRNFILLLFLPFGFFSAKLLDSDSVVRWISLLSHLGGILSGIILSKVFEALQCARKRSFSEH